MAPLGQHVRERVAKVESLVPLARDRGQILRIALRPQIGDRDDVALPGYADLIHRFDDTDVGYLENVEIYEERFAATKEAVRRARHGVIGALDRSGFSDPTLHAKVALAVSEAVANSVRHAYPADGPAGHVAVIVIHTPEGLIVTVNDHDAGLDPDNHRPGLGIGLPIMHSQADRVDIDSDSNGTTVTLHFAIT